MMLTILTGWWETSYLINYSEVRNMSLKLIEEKQHTWMNDYDITYIWPPKLSKIFYAEYGAWADREYMSGIDNWSKIIEGSHCSQCGLFSLFAILFKLVNNHNNYLLCLGVAMGTQFMNSYLYIYCYFIQEQTPSNINYNSSKFPSDIWLIKRPFMWVNIFWLIMPFYSILYYILENLHINSIKNINNIKLKSVEQKI